MKKKLLIIAVVLIASVVIFFFNLSSTGKKLDAESKDYVDQAVPVISKNWDEKELRKRASEEFMSVTSDAELEQLFDYVDTNLGSMKDYYGSRGESRIFMRNTKKEITASYVVQAEFEKGKASINVSLIKKGDKWSILEYKVNSEVFKPY
jgi:hydrogenase maturation factor HypE